MTAALAFILGVMAGAALMWIRCAWVLADSLQHDIDHVLDGPTEAERAAAFRAEVIARWRAQRGVR